MFGLFVTMWGKCWAAERYLRGWCVHGSALTRWKMPADPKILEKIMNVYSGFLDPRLKAHPRAVAIGVFDGIHLGHQKIIRSMLRDAKRLGISSAIVTFHPHPEHVLGRHGPDSSVLLSLHHRLALLKATGVQECIVVRFNRAFSKVSAENFLNKFLLGRLRMRSLSVGKGFRFGRQARGDEHFLKESANREGFLFHCIQPLRRRGEIVSSTRIRRLILSCRFSEASILLGRPYAIEGTVVAGRGRGRRIGFPTANLDPHHEVLPPSGVYAASGKLKGKSRNAVVHIGSRPTFSDREKTVEIHFLNPTADIYGQDIELEFKGRLRSVKRFKSVEDLKAAIAQDIHKALKLFKLPIKTRPV